MQNANPVQVGQSNNIGVLAGILSIAECKGRIRQLFPTARFRFPISANHKRRSTCNQFGHVSINGKRITGLNQLEGKAWREAFVKISKAVII